MSSSTPSGHSSSAVYLSLALIFAAVAFSLAWLQVENVIDPAASQIVSLGTGTAVVVVLLRVLELYAGREE